MSNRKRTSRGASNQKPKPPANRDQQSSQSDDDDAVDADPDPDADVAAGDSERSGGSAESDASSGDDSSESTKARESSTSNDDSSGRSEAPERRQRSNAARSSAKSASAKSASAKSSAPKSSSAKSSSAKSSSARRNAAAKSRPVDDGDEQRPAGRTPNPSRGSSSRSAPAKRSAASGNSRSASERGTRSSNGRRPSERAEGDNPRLPAADRSERRTPRSAASRGPEDAPPRARRTREESGDDSGGSRRAARSAPSRQSRQAPPQREFAGGFDVITVEPDQSAGRHRPLEALWFELADAWGADGIGPVALVAVPEMTAEDAAHFALRLAEVGAEIGGRSIRLITALDIGPSDAELLAEMATGSELTMLVVQSPTADPAAIPLLRRCTSVVPVVQLGSSLEDEVDQLVDSLGASRVPTVLAVDRPPKRRRFSRKKASAGASAGPGTKRSGRPSKKQKKQKKQRAEVSA